MKPQMIMLEKIYLRAKSYVRLTPQGTRILAQHCQAWVLYRQLSRKNLPDGIQRQYKKCSKAHGSVRSVLKRFRAMGSVFDVLTDADEMEV